MLESLDTLIAFVLIMLVVSLLITIAVQVVSSLLNLRGLNLLAGLSNTLTLIAPDVVQDTKELARCVLKGRLLSDSFLPDWPIICWWRHSSAIRPDEIFDAVHRIAIAKKIPDDATLRQNAQSLLVALGMDRQALKDAADEILGAQKTVRSFADSANKAVQAVSNAKIRDQVQVVLSEATAKVATYEAQTVAAAEKAVGAAATSIDAAYQKFKYWTDICQERVQQWFTMHTRIITVVCAFVFAFGLQLDTVDIFKLVSSNKAVRDQLVAQAGAVQAQAARVLGDSNTVLKDALKAWSAKQTDPAITALLANLANVEVKDTDTREAVQDKVTKALGGKTPIDSFDAMVNATATQRLKEQAGNFSTVKADFEKSGFDLFPKDSRFRWGKTWSKGFNEHLAGMLFSVGLLSLGAPFWYNALKNLVSLRSTVAQNISKEQNQAQQQQQDDGSTPKPPPATVMPAAKS
jgi:hypothetical protein